MKTTTIQQVFFQQKKGIWITIALQLCIAMKTSAQGPNGSPINVNVPQNINVLRNPGPNGLGGANMLNEAIININVIDNNTQGPNGLGNVNQAVFTPPAISAATTSVPKAPAVKKKKPAPQPVINTARVSRPIVANTPKPKPAIKRTNNPRPVSVVRRANPVRPTRTTVTPTVVTPPVTTPVQPQVAVINNPVPVTPTPPAIVEQTATIPTPVQLSNVSPVTAAVAVQNVRATPASSGSAGSGSSGSTSHHKSKHKSLAGFRYTTHKKFLKLVAKTKKLKIDPARCFVWG